MAKLTIYLTIGALLMATGFSIAQQSQPVELGTVRWNRDLEKAKLLSAKSGKPIFVQFQEVPG